MTLFDSRWLRCWQQKLFGFFESCLREQEVWSLQWCALEAEMYVFLCARESQLFTAAGFSLAQLPAFLAFLQWTKPRSCFKSTMSSSSGRSYSGAFTYLYLWTLFFGLWMSNFIPWIESMAISSMSYHQNVRLVSSKGLKAFQLIRII